ncbi:hypothetical protein BT67DRAFT_429600 [Trichocladium antarcticum]|uniref:Rhodopsin domain-containing protein n=1 Tax=Trichocladium antarcticum TaxID=1450529 RepID=A0AAN6UD71_9PEZI|nr:hypothetical protein BT67DRAFT_429600 [Trichocladium antarcticum]
MALQDINPLGVKLYVLLIVSLVLVWIFSMLRAYAKLIVLKKVSLDDGLMLVSVLIFSTHASISIWGITYASMEAHVDHAQSHYIALYTWFISEVLYAPLSALIRTSIAVFLLRIPPARAYRFIIYANILVVWILCVAYFFLLVFQCNPPSHFYMQVLGQPGSCIAPETIPCATIVHSILSALTDFTLASLPIAIMWNLRLKRRTKIVIAAILGMGFLQVDPCFSMPDRGC